MSGQELKALAEALGWPVAIVFFVAIVLAKNGWLRLIIRGDRAEEITALRKDTDELEAAHNALQERVRELETKVAILEDRSTRK